MKAGGCVIVAHGRTPVVISDHVDWEKLGLDRVLFGEQAMAVPNRLYGASINEFGEAV